MTSLVRPFVWVGAGLLTLALTACHHDENPRTGGESAAAGAVDAKSQHNRGLGTESQPDATTPTPDGETAVAAPPPTRIGGVKVRLGAPGASPSRLPGLARPHAHASQAPLLSTPLPVLATSKGRLATGYPTRVLPLAPHSQVMVSSVSPSGHRLQASLTARGRVRPMHLERFYRLRLAGLGFRAESTPTVAGTTAVAFGRGDNHVTLTIRPGRVTHYTLFATLSAD